MLGPDFFAEARRPAGTHAEQLSAFRSEWGLQVARRLEFVQSKLIGRDVLDFGSGHGQFLQAAQPLARSVTGVELEEQVREFYASHGIRLFRTLQDLDAADDGGAKRFDVITAFHVLEHLRDPLAVLRGLGDHLAARGRLVVEVPNADDALLTIYQCPAFMKFYYVGHLYLFNAHTLRLLARRAGFEVDFIRGVQRWPLSNTLYWLSRGEPGGHQHWGGISGQ